MNDILPPYLRNNSRQSLPGSSDSSVDKLPTEQGRQRHMSGVWGSLHPHRIANTVVERHWLYTLLLTCDVMGCRHSHHEDPDDPSVESLRYRRRSTKLKRSKRKKSSKQKTDLTSPQQVSLSVEGEAPLDSAQESNVHEQTSSGNPASKSKQKNIFGKSRNKNVNERVQMFGNQSIRNVLTMSVDTPEAAEIEAKQGKFGSKHVFPIWESHYLEGCKCVNLDLNDASSTQQDGRRPSTTSTARLCKRCSQVILNNKRGVSNNNNGTVENGATVNGSGASGGNGDGGGGELSQDPAKQIQIAAIANLLALAALDLSAPASSLLIKNRKNAWIQLAGHPGSFAPAGPSTIWKKRIAKENYETIAYQALSDYPKSSDIMPAFYREVEYNGEYFIEMEDLLHHFNDPSIMDIKMGTRTFLESEVKNPVLRKDLYEKMIKLDPDAPTPEEREAGAITKLRYMQFREHESSTANLGFRIEAIRMSGEPPNTNLKKVKTKEEVSFFIENFVQGHEEVIPALYQRLCDIRKKFSCIPFFDSHEIIGSSLLFMYDSSNHAGVWMIDFAKTIPVQDVTLNHRSPWQLDNHEDGYLFGLDNLIEIFGGLVEKQKAESSEGLEKTVTS